MAYSPCLTPEELDSVFDDQCVPDTELLLPSPPAILPLTPPGFDGVAKVASTRLGKRVSVYKQNAKFSANYLMIVIIYIENVAKCNSLDWRAIISDLLKLSLWTAGGVLWLSQCCVPHCNSYGGTGVRAGQ